MPHNNEYQLRAYTLDQTVSALGSFFLAMVLYPEVQAQARQELDQVVGSHRLPTFADQPSLPYIQAIVRETLRWNPVVPLGKAPNPTASERRSLLMTYQMCRTC